MGAAYMGKLTILGVKKFVDSKESNQMLKGKTIVSFFHDKQKRLLE